MKAPDPAAAGDETGADTDPCEDEHCAHHAPMVPVRRELPKIGRNDPCPCGSGKKHKKCCLGKAPE